MRIPAILCGEVYTGDRPQKFGNCMVLWMIMKAISRKKAQQPF